MTPTYALPDDVAQPGAVVNVLATPPPGQSVGHRTIGTAFIADADLLTVRIDDGVERSPGSRYWRSDGREVRFDGPPRRRIRLAPAGTPPPIERGPEPGVRYETYEETVARTGARRVLGGSWG